jgi:hypothetical protein
MKYFHIILLLTALSGFGSLSFSQKDYFSSNPELETVNQIRKLFYEAVESEEKLEELENLFSKNFLEKDLIYHPTLLAYTGAIDALKAKHAFNPFTKFSRVLSSLNTLERAVNREPNNLEIRFIRFSILHNLPGFLGYGRERNDDMMVIVSQLAKKDYTRYDPKLQINVIEFMLKSERLNDSQTVQLKKLAVALVSNE